MSTTSLKTYLIDSLLLTIDGSEERNLWERASSVLILLTGDFLRAHVANERHSCEALTGIRLGSHFTLITLSLVSSSLSYSEVNGWKPASLENDEIVSILKLVLTYKQNVTTPIPHMSLWTVTGVSGIWNSGDAHFGSKSTGFTADDTF